MSAEQQSSSRSVGLAWRAAVAHCPWCSGTGRLDGELDADDCAHCEGSGDLLRTMLEHAYCRGRDEALAKMREVYGVVVLAGQQVRDTPLPDLKREAGL